MDLATNYLGLKLANPFIPGASPLSNDLDNVRKLAAHGAAAVVLHSIFEEQITREPAPRSFYEDLYSGGAGHGARRFAHTPQTYLEHIENVKKAGKIPTIASINCSDGGNWASFATQIQSAGADALELNIYFMATDPKQSATEIEARMIELIRSVRSRIQIPLAIKLCPYFTSLPNLVRGIESAGANGVVLFNRFYQPDFEVASKAATHSLDLSNMSDVIELRLRLRWIAILSPQTQMSLAVTGGVHTGLDAIKCIMAGADAIQIVSALLNAGPEQLSSILENFTQHVRDLKANSLREIRGCMNHQHCPDPAALERSGYLSILHKWSQTHAMPEGMHAF